MPTDRVVRVYQEDWWPFQNLPNALARFTAETGIKTELSWDKVGVGSIEKMFEEMLHSFSHDDPPFDLVCTDEIMLRRVAQEGRVLVLNDLMRRDGISLDDVTAATRNAIMLDGQILGLPCVNVCSMLLYRRDLLDKHGLDVPMDWASLKIAGAALQEGERKTGAGEFYGFATRGAPGGGHAVWTVSSFVASFGGTWFDRDGRPTANGDANRDALSVYVDLLRTIAPPGQDRISFVEMLRDYRAGRVGMIMDVGMEYANLMKTEPDLAARTGIALIPAGPEGRFANLYSPPWAIPARSKVKNEAFELAKYLTTTSQLEEDGLNSEALETSALSVLYGTAFDGHFRDDLLAVTRATRAIAKEERPFSTLGIEACAVVGDLTTEALTGRLEIGEALDRMQRGLERLRTQQQR